MLPKSSRVSESQDLRDTLSKGIRAGREHLVVYVRRRQDGSARAGFIVSKKVGNAVVRNRVKRRLRHIAPAAFAQLPNSVDVVVRALPGAATADLASEFLAAASRCPRRVDAS
ncbi:MAG: ribonuclease P protein component [Propionibacteriaceae bacterium]|nr:ribonuclease P protein component [Propionibacteriaceae bacterium]